MTAPLPLLPHPDPAAEQRLWLEQRVAELHDLLSSLQIDIPAARDRLGDTESARLLEANGQLLVAALDAQTAAETSAQALQEVSLAARRDDLTGLPNRALLHDRLDQALLGCRRHASRLAVLFLDLNGFKQINDSFGHAVGDLALVAAASRLSHCVRETDTVGRYGGDEFVVVLAGVTDAADATRVAEKMIDALAVPIAVDDGLLTLSVSIGICIHPEDGADAAALLRGADAAMYRAKGQGPGSFVFGSSSAGDGPLLSKPAADGRRRLWVRHGPVAGHAEQLLAHLQEANEKLVIAALNAQELQSAAEHAQRRQVKFMAVLAHELRNPLTPLSHAARLLEHADADRTILPRMRAVIQRQVAHMARLLDDLLDLSRVHAGKLRVQRLPLDLGAVVDGAVDTFRLAMEHRQQRFTLHREAGPVPVLGDAERLHQVFGNLLGNASKYTPAGGAIGFSLSTSDGRAVIAVSDDGIGITAEALPRIFDPFMQEPHAVAFDGGGLGIGLTVVRELVEAHGGTVRAFSAGSGQGSLFEVTLALLDVSDTDRLHAPAN